MGFSLRSLSREHISRGVFPDTGVVGRHVPGRPGVGLACGRKGRGTLTSPPDAAGVPHSWFLALGVEDLLLRVVTWPGAE